MSESFLSPATGDTESHSPPLVSTRQKKSMSAPDVYLPRSLSQLEEDVSWPCGVRRAPFRCYSFTRSAGAIACKCRVAQRLGGGRVVD